MAMRRRRDGLSLIELLVVIALIGVLTMLAVPRHDSVRDRARSVAAHANLRAVLLAEMQYFDANRNYTVDRSALLKIEPSLPLGNEGRPGSIYIVVAISKANPAVCLFTESGTGWHTIYHSEQGGTLTGLGSPADCTRRILDEQRPRQTTPRGARPIPIPGRVRRSR